jgi:hypothetical protein
MRSVGCFLPDLRWSNRTLRLHLGLLSVFVDVKGLGMGHPGEVFATELQGEEGHCDQPGDQPMAGSPWTELKGFFRQPFSHPEIGAAIQP